MKKTGDQNLRLYPKGSGDLRLCQCCVRVRARSGDSGSGDSRGGDGGCGDDGSGDEAESRRQEGAKCEVATVGVAAVTVAMEVSVKVTVKWQ